MAVDFLKNSESNPSVFLEQTGSTIASFLNFSLFSHCFILFSKIKTVAVETQAVLRS